MLQRAIKNPLFWIFLISLVLRVFKLGLFPNGFHADEVRVGWNAYSILKTTLDDHGGFLSAYYNTFGDYRPTGIFYLTIPSIIAFGLTEFAIRFPSALFGALTTIPIFLIANFISKNKKLALVASSLIAINPWHIETSRATSEVVISTFFALFAIYFFLKLIEKSERKFVVLTVVFSLLSFSLYHSIRILMPVLLGLVTFYYFNEIKNNYSKKLILTTLLIVFGITLLTGVSKSSKERFGQVSIFKDIDLIYQTERTKTENISRTPLRLIFDNKIVVYTNRLVNEYSTYFSPQFLIGNSGKPFRYATPGVGIITLIEFGLLIFGLIGIAQKKFSALPLVLLLIAPIPAFLTSEDSPNLHRSFLMLPFLMIIEAYGFIFLSEVKKNKKEITYLISALLLMNFVYFFHMYFHHSLTHRPFIKNLPTDISSYRNVGAKELSYEVLRISNDYDKVVVTGFPDNLYPWIAFFNKLSPREFNKNIKTGNNGVIEYGNITLSNLRCPSDDSFTNEPDKNILVIDYADCAYESKIRDGLPIKILKTINGPENNRIYVFLEKTGEIPEKFLRN